MNLAVSAPFGAADVGCFRAMCLTLTDNISDPLMAE
jgi:hypothetical protein